jgi:hypothetical protein
MIRFLARKTKEKLDFALYRSAKKTVVEHTWQLDSVHDRENMVLSASIQRTLPSWGLASPACG